MICILIDEARIVSRLEVKSLSTQFAFLSGLSACIAERSVNEALYLFPLA